MFAVMELKEKGLLENGEEMPNKFEGLSRREIVRKVGAVSLAALPIVSSIIAPKAAAATTPPCVFAGNEFDIVCPGDTLSCLRNECSNEGATRCCSTRVDRVRCTGLDRMCYCGCV